MRFSRSRSWLVIEARQSGRMRPPPPDASGKGGGGGSAGVQAARAMADAMRAGAMRMNGFRC